jgi:uncharacterized membrane protein YvbJ
MICPKCKAEIPDSSKFCNKCGNPVADRHTKLKPDKVNLNKSVLKSSALDKVKLLTKKQILIIVICLLVILGVCIGGFLFYKNTPEQRAIVYAKQQANNMQNTMKDTLLTIPDKVITIEKKNNIYKVTFSGTYYTWPDSYPKNENPDTHKYNVQYIITVQLNSNNQFSLKRESMKKISQIY